METADPTLRYSEADGYWYCFTGRKAPAAWFFFMEVFRTKEITGPWEPAPQMGKIVGKLMDKASVTAEDVAEDIARAVLGNRFLVITHPDARRQYHLKRLAPEIFFAMVRRSTAAFLSRR